MSNIDVREYLLERGYDDTVIFDNPSYDTAFLGVTDSGRAAYGYERMIDYLVETEDMSYDEAADFICYNSSFMPDTSDYPIIIFEAKYYE